MRLIEIAHDDLSTVEEAIAFIDEFDKSLYNRNEDNTVSSPLSSASSDSGVVYPVKISGSKRKNPPGYSTQMQQRKKLEISQLRAQVQDLEQQITLMKKQKLKIQSPRRAAHQSKWETLVANKYDERQRSEEINRKLKTILGYQENLDKNLRRVLQKRSLLQGIDFVFGNEPSFRNTIATLKTSKSIMDQLARDVETLYVDSSSLFKVAAPPGTSSKLKILHDKVHGKIVKGHATTPLTCSLKDATDICWEYVSTTRPCPEKWTRCMKGSHQNSCEKSWILSLPGVSSPRKVEGVQYVRKFEERNRAVIITADIANVIGEDLEFRSHSQIIITRSPSNRSSSVVRVFEQLHQVRDHEADVAGPLCAESIKTEILRGLSWVLRDQMTHMQDTLIEKMEYFGDNGC
ncbi:hypothetical protein PHPALM_28064 [Phytophthora palmivora]|uniref:M96 mating-specific protein family n=1 Tax=Phytophthora palmivora TaxID=4796 RepID=A0A2P4XB00_9STRA|nr:hypothetical protein PHPALM_28064 [Phytophthora palmivora]